MTEAVASIPVVIQPLLKDYLARLESVLPGLVTAVYLHGSIALGAFNPRLSDIDFIAITSRRCTDDDLAHLKATHDQIAQQYPNWKLEGSYLQAGDLGKSEAAIPPYPCIHDGVLNPADHFDISNVTWWVLKNRGITLLGTPSHELNFNINWDELIVQMRDNLNSYWANWKQPQALAFLKADSGIEWAVLGPLRQYYSFREGSITSKTGAGEYGLAHLPAQWHPLIQEAIDIREQGSTTSRFASPEARANEAQAFLRYLIETSNALFA